MSSITSQRTDSVNSPVEVNSSTSPPHNCDKVDARGVNLPPLMFDGREDSKEYVNLEGTSSPDFPSDSKDVNGSCISTWIE